MIILDPIANFTTGSTPNRYAAALYADGTVKISGIERTKATHMGVLCIVSGAPTITGIRKTPWGTQINAAAPPAGVVTTFTTAIATQANVDLVDGLKRHRETW